MAETERRLNPPMGGCEVEQPEGWYCSREFHHNGPCACHRLPEQSGKVKGVGAPADALGSEPLGNVIPGPSLVHVNPLMRVDPATGIVYDNNGKPWPTSIRGTHEPAAKQENSGLNVDYYRVHITMPNQADAPYVAECSDIIEHTGMDFNEGEAFKALWRNAAARTLGKQKAGDDAIRNAQKVFHFGRRILERLTGKKVEQKVVPPPEVSQMIADLADVGKKFDNMEQRILARMSNIRSTCRSLSNGSCLSDAVHGELEGIERALNDFRTTKSAR